MFTSAATTDDTLDPFQLTGRAHSHIVELPEPRTNLHRGVVRPFLALRAAAAADGIDLIAVSGFRDFARQRLLWNEKYRGERTLLDRDGTALDVQPMTPIEIVRAILHWSALPGASRHHWGTEIDVIDRAALAPDQHGKLIPAEFAAGGVFAPLTRWLDEHAGRFGFFRPYDRDRGGVQPEPWHLSFAPLAQPALQALTLPVLHAALTEAQQQADTQLLGYAAFEPLLPEIYARYVQAVADPGLNRAATPS